MKIIRLLIILFPLFALFWLPLSELAIGAYTFKITLSDLVLLIISFAFIAKKSSFTKINTSGVKIIFCCWLICLSSILSSLINSGYRDALADLITYSKRIGEYSLLVLILPALCSYKEKMHSLYSLNIIGIIISFNAIVEYYKSGGRAGSWLIYPNNLGLFSVLIANFSLSTYIFSKKRGIRAISALCILSSFLSLWASGSRAASLGLLGSIFFWIFEKRGNKYSKVKMILLIAFLILLIGIIGFIENKLNIKGDGVDLFERWTEVASEGTDTIQIYSRLEASKVGLKLFLDFPIMGAGIHNVPIFSSRYLRFSNYFTLDESVNNVGNQYLQILVEGGIIAMLFFIYMIYKIFKILFLAKSYEKNNLNLIFIQSLLSISISLLISGLGMHTFYVPQVMSLYWYVLGMIYVK